MQLAFSSPTQNDILIWGQVSERVLSQTILHKRKYEIFYTRNTKIFVWLAIKAFFNVLFLSKTSLKNAYYDEYLKKVNPKVVITYEDNYLDFFTLKNIYPNAKYISIQSSARTDKINKREKKNKMFADFIFVLSQSYKKEYSKFFSGKILVLGSIVSNQVNIKKEKSNKILYISEFYDKKKLHGFPFNKMYESEKKLFKIFAKLIHEKKINLYILGRQNQSNDEKKFYEKICNADFKFIKKQPNFKNYNELDKANLIIFISSTMGYEALGRGKKIVSLSVRSKILKDKNYKFGFPEKLKDKGPFWSNSLSPRYIEKIILNNKKQSTTEWFRKNKKFIKNQMFFNYKNKKAIDLINNYLKK